MVGLLLGCPQPSKIAGFDHETLQDFWNIGFEPSKLRNEEWILTWIDGRPSIIWDFMAFMGYFAMGYFALSPLCPGREFGWIFQLRLGCWTCHHVIFDGKIHPFFIGKSTISMVMTNIAIENDHRNSGFSHWKWWFSIVMLVYQRVFLWQCSMANC